MRVKLNLFNQSLLAVCLIFISHSISAQSLYEMPQNVESRMASGENPKGEKGKGGQTNGGRKGSPTVQIKAGESRVLAQANGTSGTVRRIWMTFRDRSPQMLRSLKIEMFWDGAAKPAVSAPLGDFFGVGLGQTTVFQSAFFSNPEGRSFNCIIPMPFRTGMKIVLTNESKTDLRGLFYDVDYTLGDKHSVNTLYFHAFYRRENPTTMQKDYEILPQVKGRGRYLGANVGVIVNSKEYFNTWWGEGEIKMYLDGDRALPTIVGTGTEDYIGTAWGEGQFANLYAGSPVADEKNMRWAFYRYHVVDPIYFYRAARVTIQQIGYLTPDSRPPIVENKRTLYRAGAGLVPMDTSKNGEFERSDDWSSCVYFYLDKPADNLPPIDSVEKRIADL
ncbi:MAG: DUF2961 domain-containing protein [Acidobacteriota bacterium]|nr:DUF2961 domain-containing protein [Acidobacteriota bacterium]